MRISIGRFEMPSFGGATTLTWSPTAVERVVSNMVMVSRCFSSTFKMIFYQIGRIA